MVLACLFVTAERPQRTFSWPLWRALDSAVVRHLEGRPDRRFRLAALGGSRRYGHYFSIDLGEPALYERRHFFHGRLLLSRSADPARKAHLGSGGRHRAWLHCPGNREFASILPSIL